MKANFPIMVPVTAVALVTLALTGCGNSGTEPVASVSSTPAADDPTIDTAKESLGVTLEARLGLNDVEFTVGPLVNDGDLSVLMMSARDVSSDPKRSVSIGVLWNDFDVSFSGAKGVRLFDGDAGTVEEAVTVDGHEAVTHGNLSVKAEPVEFSVVFGTSDAKSVDILVPFAGLAENVPVLDRSELADLDGGDVLEESSKAALKNLVPDPSVAVRRSGALLTVSRSLDGAVDTQTAPDQVLINVDADVLFDVDKFDITPAADAALASAAGQLTGYSAGSLSIVGHTDDVGDTEHNQVLSERRAQAVSDWLTSNVDLTGYDVSVEGRGETQPRVAGTTAEDRAANRRVELVFTPAQGATTPAPAVVKDFALPDSAGPTATGKNGVTVLTLVDREVKVSIDSVQRVGGYLVGQLTAENQTDSKMSSGPDLSINSGRSIGGKFAPNQLSSQTNIALISGDQRVFPAVYFLPEDDPATSVDRPMAERVFGGSIDPGGSYSFTIVWPDVSVDDEVMIDVAALKPEYVQFARPFRLTDIPVIK